MVDDERRSSTARDLVVTSDRVATPHQLPSSKASLYSTLHNALNQYAPSI
jgi:hypothetical protein